jgi:hypothetical protein
MNRTGTVKPGVATGRAPSRPATRWFVSMVGVGLPLVVACATTINGLPADNGVDGSTPAADADPDAFVGTDDSSTSPMPDTGGNPMNDVGTAPTDDGSLGMEGAPANDAAPPMESGSPMDSAPIEAAPPIDSAPPRDAPPMMDNYVGPMDSSPPVDSGGACAIRPTLPYPVDGSGTQFGFITTGYEGDNCAISMPGTPGACPGHAFAGTALGKCWSITLTHLPTACTDGGTLQGWGGVLWQYPMSNWSQTPPGLNICGATKVTFWAAGAVGGESVTFFAGNTLPAPGFQAKLQSQSLSTTFTQFTMMLPVPAPDTGVNLGFGWTANELPTVGGTVKFMVDNIQWQ